MTIKKKALALFLASTLSLAAYGDWSFGTAAFRGSKPSIERSIGDVHVWYNGSLRCTGSIGGVEIWEGTGDICVAYPGNYSGKQLRFISTGGSVQIQYLR